jgi:hypothetical protein
VQVADTQLPARLASKEIKLGDSVQLCLRPEQLHLRPAQIGATDELLGKLSLTLPQGAHVIQEVVLKDGTSLKVSHSRSVGQVSLESGAAVALQLLPGCVGNAFLIS